MWGRKVLHRSGGVIEQWEKVRRKEGRERENSRGGKEWERKVRECKKEIEKWKYDEEEAVCIFVLISLENQLKNLLQIREWPQDDPVRNLVKSGQSYNIIWLQSCEVEEILELLVYYWHFSIHRNFIHFMFKCNVCLLIEFDVFSLDPQKNYKCSTWCVVPSITWTQHGNSNSRFYVIISVSFLGYCCQKKKDTLYLPHGDSLHSCYLKSFRWFC